MDLYVNNIKLTKIQKEALVDMKERRSEGEPLQYVLGSWDFCGSTLATDARALVPRPETEILVEEAIEKLNEFKDKPSMSVLNIGVGTGNIEIALAKQFANLKVTGVDISREALDLACENVITCNVAEQVTLIEADAYKYFKEEAPQKFELVISNPPYIPTQQLGDLPDDVRQEPSIALDGGKDGLKFYRLITRAAVDIVVSNGWLMFECGDNQHEAIADMINDTKSFSPVTFVKDYVGVKRVVIAQRL